MQHWAGCNNKTQAQFASSWYPLQPSIHNQPEQTHHITWFHALLKPGPWLEREAQQRASPTRRSEAATVSPPSTHHTPEPKAAEQGTNGCGGDVGNLHCPAPSAFHFPCKPTLPLSPSPFFPKPYLGRKLGLLSFPFLSQGDLLRGLWAPVTRLRFR